MSLGRCDAYGNVDEEQPDANTHPKEEGLVVELSPNLLEMSVFFVCKQVHLDDLLHEGFAAGLLGAELFEGDQSAVEAFRLTLTPVLQRFLAVVLQVGFDLLEVLQVKHVRVENAVSLHECGMDDTQVAVGDSRAEERAENGCQVNLLDGLVQD